MIHTISCIIPASSKDLESQKLKDLISSIQIQRYPQDKIEIMVITEGDSEQAKGLGISRANGTICAMFCADNMIMDKDLFTKVSESFKRSNVFAVYPIRYFHDKKDYSLNRYFSLIGGNDPVCWFLGKNDREPHAKELKRSSSYPPSYGCNGFFYRSYAIKATDLDHYYPMDNAMEVKGDFLPLDSDAIWHRTSDNLIKFLIKRYHYARDLYCDRSDRRWKMVDTAQDKWRLAGFVLSTISIIPSLLISFQGFCKVRDFAWFWHWPVSCGFLITYGVLTCRNILLTLLSSRRLEDLKRLKDVLSPSGIKHLKISR